MLKNLAHSAVVLFILSCFATIAMAQEPVPEENKTFESSTYDVSIPNNWTTITGELDSNELEKLPQSVREHYNPQAMDAMFVNLSDKDIRDDDFKDCINIVIVNEVIPNTDEMIAELKTLIEQQYASFFEEFRLLNFDWVTQSGRKALNIQAQYKLLNYELGLEQFVISTDKNAIILTCTYERSRESAMRDICSKTFTSLKTK